ncbi:S41 family peptidase [Sporosarcina soli]|uniref:S41 family peptidase n=1 Tax=Sporosarcina soli TaxID=334736 RepID=A0ABW0THM3_9BACL
MRTNIKILLVALLTVLFFQVSSASAQPIDDIRELVRDYYVDDIPESVLSKGSITDITNHLDPYSVYMTAKEYEQFINSIEQRIVGIGVVLEEDGKGVKVTSVIPKGPADQAGIQAGDIITKIDGKSVVGKAVQTAVSLITGEENTMVTLTIERPASREVLTKQMKRQAISLPNVEFAMLGGDIGYIRLNSFSTESAKEVNDAMNSLAGADGWILDLRDNGGGFITAAQEITGFFPKAKNAFQLREKNEAPVVYKSESYLNQFQKPVHLLVNAYSASASEMVAAAVKEQQAATLYGQTSYGKGTMQSMFSFTDGSVLKLTTARFYSPGGESIDKTGVKPNIVTKIGEELEQSHRSHLLAKLKNYKQHPSLVNVPVTKTFTVEMNTSMDWKDIDASAVQLIELGGVEQPVTIDVKNDQTITVIPKQPLLSGNKYMLLIHPLWKGKNQHAMKQGIYLDVSVK